MSQSRDEHTINEEPLFNIGAVSRMTEIPETTLRVWERRYEFPRAARTAGGHRLYSQQEVRRLQWVKLRVADGMQISQAIRALHSAEREQDGQHISATLETFQTGQGTPNPAARFQKQLIDGLLHHDAERADQILAEALVLFPLEFLILHVIGPTFYDIGEAWAEGRVDVATEHFATNHLRHHLLLWMRTSPPAYRVNPIVLACAPAELHEGSLLMLAVMLRRLRWPVVYLGQTMPISDLAAFLADIEPAVIVFVAMSEETALALADWPHWMPDAARSNRPVVGYGGRAFLDRPEIAEQIPGLWLGETLEEGVQTLDRMLHDMNPLLR